MPFFDTSYEDEHTKSVWAFAPLRAIAALCVAVFLSLVLLLIVLQSRSFSVPVRYVSMITADISDNIKGDLVVEGNATIRLTDLINPNVGLQHVRLLNETGVEIVSLANAQVTFDTKSLFTSNQHIKEILVSGLHLNGKRDADGTYDFNVNNSGAGGISGLNFKDFLATLERTLQENGLSDLERLVFDQVVFDYTDNVVKRRWTFDGGRVVFENTANQLRLRADLALLSGVGEVGTLAVEIAQNAIGNSTISAEVDGVAARDLAQQIPSAPWLSLIDATASGTMRSSITDAGLGPLHASLNFGSGSLLIAGQPTPTDFSKAKTNFTVLSDQSRMDVHTFEVSSNLGNLSASGHAILQDGSMIVQLLADSLLVNPNGVLPQAISANYASLDADIQFDPFVLTLGRARLNLDTGTEISATGKIASDTSGWTRNFEFKANQFEIADAVNFWPVDAKVELRRWIDERADGVISNLIFKDRRDAEGQGGTALSLDFDEATIKFLPEMPPLQNASGSANLVGTAFGAILSKAELATQNGDVLRVGASSFSMPVANIKEPPVRIQTTIRSTANALFSVLNNPPINFLKNINRPADFIRANMVTDIDLSLRLSKSKEKQNLVYAAQSKAMNVFSNDLIKDRTLTSSKLNIDVSPSLIKVAGPFKVGDIAGQGEWSMVQGQPKPAKSQVKATVSITPSALTSLGLSADIVALRGQTNADVRATLQAGTATQFSATIPLRGAALSIPQIGWSKTQNSRGTVTLDGSIGSKLDIQKLAIDAPGLSGTSAIAFGNDRKLASLQANNLKISSFLNGDVIFRPGSPTRIDVSKGTVDLNGLVKTLRPASGKRNAIVANVSRLKVADKIFLRNVEWQGTASGNRLGSFRAQVNKGRDVIFGQVQRDGSNTKVIISAENGGHFLRDAGVYPNISGGSLDLILVVRPNGTIKGNATLSQARLSNAPAVAELLSAVSVVGLLEQLDGNGLVLSETEAEFFIQDGLITLTKSSSIGPSLGLSLDGFFNTKANTVDLQGVVSPLYLINGIGSIFTRRGEGLLGFNFNLKGDSASPRVSVNPLSILTPAMFREIFRRPPPKPPE